MQIKHAHVGADSLFVIDQSLIEAARGTVSEDTGEDIERGVIGVGTGGAVIDHHQFLAIADAAEADGPLAILGGFDGIGFLESAGGLGYGAEEVRYHGEGLGLVELAGNDEKCIIGLVVLLDKTKPTG